MEYSFDVDHAVKYGVDEAIFLKNLIFWIKKNKANNRHFYDGHTWTYNSVKAYSELFPFWTYAKIRGIIDKLIKEGVIMKGNYNSNTYDRTMWYCIIDKSICENQQLHLLELANGSAENDKSYTDNKTDNKPYINTYIDIFNYWNDKKIIKHSEKTYEREFKKKHADVIDDYGHDEVKKAIDNYSIVYKSDKYYFTYRWNLFDFITKGVKKFINDADPLNNFKNKEQKSHKDSVEEIIKRNNERFGNGKS